jgi:CubicO group peptidase (beta-lactamase class C family)
MLKHLRNTLILLVVATFGLAPVAHAQTSELTADKKQKIDAHIEKWRKNWDTPTVQVGIIENGELSYKKSYGEVIASDKTLYINSMAKPMTAYGVMLLVQNGKLSLDDPVSKYLPDFAVAKHNVTIKNLLNHTSGLTSQANQDILARSYPSVASEALAMRHTPIDPAQIGTLQYANVGYLFLGYIIEKVSHMEYDAYMKENVFRPLGMSRTSATAGNIAQGYSGFFTTNIPMNMPYSVGNGPFGSIHSTIDDVAKFLAAQSRDYPLKKEYRDMMLREKVPYWDDGTTYRGQGLGWIVSKETNEPDLVLHEGFGVGYQSSMAVEPSTGFGIILIANKIYYLDDTMSPFILSEAIHDIYQGKTPKEIPASFTLLRSIGLISLVVLFGAAIYVVRRIKRPIKHVRIVKVAGVLVSVTGLAIIPIVLYVGDASFSLAFMYAADVVVTAIIVSVELIVLGILTYLYKPRFKRTSTKKLKA